MKKKKVLTITALAAVALFAIGVLVFGLTSGFGFGDFVSTIDNGVYDTPYVYEEEADALYDMEVHWESGPVDVRLYDGATIRVTETARGELAAEERLTLEMSGGSLTVNWNGSFWSFATLRSKPKKLEIDIPRSIVENLESVHIQSASGKITMADLDLLSATYETVSGDIELSNIEANLLEVKTTSGKLECTALDAEESLTVSSVSGDVELTEAKAAELKISMTSGALKAAVTADAVTCTSVSGDISLTTAAWAKTSTISTVSGQVTLTAPEPANGFLCKFTSVSGDFDSAFETTHSGDRYQNGQGEAKLEISTTSGDVEIERAP